jgi:hypothetical protein
MDMVQSRALTVHSYDEKVAKKVATSIVDQYSDLFKKLEKDLSALKENS